MSKPTSVLSWAENTVIESVSIGGNNVTVINTAEPNTNIKATGVLARQPFKRQYFNWFYREISRWINYIHGGEIGDYKVALPSATASTMNARYGGTWTDIGTDTIAGESIRLFKRTA